MSAETIDPTSGTTNDGDKVDAEQLDADQVRVDVVRVFTDEPGGFGNERGLIWSSPLTHGREQQIAEVLGFSETVFVEPVDVAQAGTAATASIRIFTPANELPFAGHPSVGCAWWLADGGTPVEALEEKAGRVAVSSDGELTWITGEAAWAPEFEWIELDTPSDVEALDDAQFTAGNHYAWAWYNEDAGRLRSRMFAPAMGVHEDEATGAAAVRITALLGRDLEITQGRGSLISTRIGEGDSIHVGGRTVFDRSIALELPPL
ncbi:MAG: hypothetical protein JWQ43_1784 [Glaciihabitans sp.]|nr:hypothetical protein [Glaciihabitans sp.]